MKKSAKFVLGLGVLVLANGTQAWGGTWGSSTVFTDEAKFKSILLPGYYQEDFAAWKFNNPPTVMPTPLHGNLTDYEASNGYFKYHAYSASHLFSLDKAISIADGGDGTGILTITFPNTTGWQKVTAVGGFFFASDYDGQPAVTDGTRAVTISLANGTVVRVDDTALQPFRGFASDVPIQSLSIQFSGYIPDGDARFPAVSELLLGTAPDADIAFATPALLGAACWLMARRRAKAAKA